MTPTEYDNLTTQLVTSAEKITRYDMLQEEIDRYLIAKGTIRQVNFITDSNTIAVTDSDMLSKAEAALDKLIAARETDKSNI